MSDAQITEPGIVRIAHGGVSLALHHLRSAPPAEPDHRLLLLHGLGEATPSTVPEPLRVWPGEIWGLDFTGHGESTIPGGGGYTAEVLMADVDHALAHLGPCTIHGRGLGAYIALLIIGARTELVRGVVLADGTGLAGGGPSPHTAAVTSPAPGAVLGTTPDPFAMMDLSRDVRPGDYASTYAQLAQETSEIENPIALTGVVRPPWMVAISELPGVVTEPLEGALTRFAALPMSPGSG